ncbi:MAG: hypothetical protein A2343_02825 [Candidatus Moranbacteria bacterium RIFOXYB12_FULL_35_8]|nr:MAG: hypothetical protein A2343_02825 [Candidatus Moranbacteria bacterium RIFOXYB12_FULL_35_8]
MDIFKYKPYRILGVKIDAIHDLFDVLLLLLSVKHEYFFYSWLITLLLIGLILFILIKKWKFIVLFISKERGYFLGMIVLFFLLSLAIDTHNVKINGANLFILEEYFEFSAAMALFFLCSSFPIKSKPLK